MVQLKSLISLGLVGLVSFVGGHYSQSKPGASINLGGYNGGNLINTNFNLGGNQPKRTKNYGNNQNSGGGSYGNPNFDINLMLQLVNQERGKYGASPLSINGDLMQAAQMQSDYQASINTMTHSGPGGNQAGDRVTQCGFNWSGVAENVAYNQQTVEEVVECWINSPPHHENLVNPTYNVFGAGMSNLYWTQVFAC
jgi:hypothetical protein